LDLYRDLSDPTTQEHDFDPGIHPYPGGLFWTLPISPVGPVELGTGTAHMSATDLAVSDFFNIPNALFHFPGSPPVDAKCSFDIHWNGPVSSRGGVTTPGSSGELVMSSATMTWSASNSNGFSFVSNPSPTTSVFAQLGRIQNGVFAE